MVMFQSCKAAIQHSLDTKTFAVAHLYKDEKTMDMHIHDTYEVYYSITGGKQFLIDNSLYSIDPGDLFFINQYESHHLTQIDQQVHERIVISIHPELLTLLSSEATDLHYCFQNHSEHFGHKLSLSEDEQKQFLYLIHKLTTVSGFGADLLEKAFFLVLIAFLNEVFHKRVQHEVQEESNQASTVYHTQVDEILSYLNQNIHHPLTIEAIADHFYMSTSYLCRIFKSSTGTTINKYLTGRRISMAKSLLSKGVPVNDVCEQCGFNDYSNFLKAFTKAVGISPKKYAQFTSQ